MLVSWRGIYCVLIDWEVNHTTSYVLTLVHVCTHAVVTLLYTVILKTGTKGLQKQRGEGGGSVKTTRSFAYMLSCGNK